jgi:hypothetical protein
MNSSILFENIEDEHLIPLCEYKNSIFDDSSIEIISKTDESENELVRLSTYLQ